MNAVFASLMLLQSPTGVTGDEARTILLKLDTLARKILSMPAPKSNPIQLSGKKPLSRIEIAKAFRSMVTTFEPKFKIAPRAIRFEKDRIRANTAVDREIFANLVSGGWIAPYGPLTSGRADSLQPREFGDATAFLVLRLMELTQTPSSKWSPMLHF